jgi:hypothetical protein
MTRTLRDINYLAPQLLQREENQVDVGKRRTRDRGARSRQRREGARAGQQCATPADRATGAWRGAGDGIADGATRPSRSPGPSFGDGSRTVRRGGLRLDRHEFPTGAQSRLRTEPSSHVWRVDATSAWKR